MIERDYAVPLDEASDILESLHDLRSEALPSHVMEVSFDDENDAVLFVLRWEPVQVEDGLWLASSKLSMSRWLDNNCPTAHQHECVRVIFQNDDEKIRFEQALCERTDCDGECQ